MATFAERGRVVPELNDPSIREVFVYKYRLQYEVREARVLVCLSWPFFTARATSRLGSRPRTRSNRRCITNEGDPATGVRAASSANPGRSTDFEPSESTGRSSATIGVVRPRGTTCETAIVNPQAAVRNGSSSKGMVST